MKATSKKLKNAITEIKVTFDNEEWQEAKDEAIKKLAKNVKIDGFRPGKAPMAMIKSKISKGAILEEATDIILQKNYAEILISKKVNPVAQPQLSVEKVDEDGLSVKMLVPVKPKVELGTYKELEVKKDKVTVTKKDIDAMLENHQQQFAELTVKEDGVVANGDTAVIDFEGFIDGVAFEGGKGENHSLEIGSGSFIPGFEEEVIGMKVNEEKDVKVTFPEDYQAELAGKEAVFKVVVHEIKVKSLPEIDDELAKDVNIEGVETLDQLKEHIKTQLKAQKTTEAENKYNEAIFKAIIENSTVEESEALVKEECNIMLQEIEQNLQQQGMTFELYEQFTGKNKESILEDVKPQAADRVKLNAILAAIVEEEKLEVSSEDVEKELQEIATYYQKDLEEVKQIFEANMERIESDLLTRKALELVKENVKK
jgi:trigger factor